MGIKPRYILIFLLAFGVIITTIGYDIYDYYKGKRKHSRGVALYNHLSDEDFQNFQSYHNIQDLPNFATLIENSELYDLEDEDFVLQIPKFYSFAGKTHDQLNSFAFEPVVQEKKVRRQRSQNEEYLYYAYSNQSHSPNDNDQENNYNSQDGDSYASLCNCCDSACNYGCAGDRYYFTLRRNEGRVVGDNSSYTTLEVTSFPCFCEDIISFVDVRGHYFDRCSHYGANAGFGFRFLPSCCGCGLFSDQIFGINAYYSYRDYRRAHFNQIGLGFEMLGDCVSFRLNGYFPIGNTQNLISRCIFDDFIGDFFMIQENYADARLGMDFEIESFLGCLCCTDFYGALGSYFYKGGFCGDDIYGTEYRLTARYCNYLMSLLATNDCCYKTKIQAELGFTFPCYGCNCDWLLYQPVRRREAIVIDKHSEFYSNF